MSLEAYLSGDCYKKLPADFRTRLVVGQFCRTVVPFVTDTAKIMEAERADSTEHQLFHFLARSMKTGDFSGHRKLPLKLLDLRSTEELVAYRAKFRPAIIVAIEKTKDAVVEAALTQRVKNLHDDTILVVPVYGAESEDHPGGIPEIMMTRVQSLAYDQFFPVFRTAGLEPSLARFDRILAVKPKPSWFEPLQVALSDAALAVLQAMLRELLGGAPDEDVVALRELLVEGLK